MGIVMCSHQSNTSDIDVPKYHDHLMSPLDCCVIQMSQHCISPYTTFE